MWTCAYYDGIDPITLSMTVRPSETHDVIPISKIRIWNYNKSLTVCGYDIKCHIITFITA